MLICTNATVVFTRLDNMYPQQISNLDDFYKIPEGTKIIGNTISTITKPGENYSSIILKVDVTVMANQKKEKIYSIAKILPKNKGTQEILNTSITFFNEIDFYKNVIPLLQNFDSNFDLFPKYHGSRREPDPVLLLENLKVQNYTTLDRWESLDLDAAEMAIKNLAYFHAVPVKFKIEKRHIFQEKIKPVLAQWRMDKDYHNKCRRRLEEIIDTIPELRSLNERILNGFDKKLVPHQSPEPFATIVHNDYWVNNIMVQFENGKPIKSKIIDLQACTYGSPAKDVLFFLFDNVKIEVLDKHYDHLVRVYYETFLSVLSQSTLLEEFSFEKFQKELDFEATNTQFGHIVFMLFVIFAPKQGYKNTDYLLDGLLIMEPTDLYKKRLFYVVNEFIKRGWL